MTKDNGQHREATSRPATSRSASSIWGGRFAGGPSEAMQRINASIEFDRRLYGQDIQASLAHAAMLVGQGIISADDGAAIEKGLGDILAEIEAGGFEFKTGLEDIHMNIEARLGELIGDAAGRLHTARSRNDQVATDFRLWVRDALDDLDGALKFLQAALIDQAESHAASIMPGYTHLQTAQPVTLGHHLLAYVEMLGRDRDRAADCRRRLNESPLGSGALAGASFPIDREQTATALGFDRPSANSLDAVSDRDFALEYLALASILGVHLSRLAEEFVLWSSDGFGFMRLSDAFTTGSSMLPQKRNPDAAELVRAKSGRVIGALGGLLIVMKGLPLAYSKDMQEDKEPVFETADTLALCISAMIGMVADAEFDIAAMQDAAIRADAGAIDIADWLVRNHGFPFRDAHHVAGRLVRLAEEKGCGLADLSLEDLQGVEAVLTADAQKVLDVRHAVEARASFGGTAPERVKAACAEARRRFVDG
ncbi:MAG: argininosuccinate lyase [Rhodospirillales bacterium]|nr:argininosuccinate lyase [Rhodospirillales bacterium]MDP6841249.1 argininosuccinate lyase [Rhodospirillales bacterium]